MENRKLRKLILNAEVLEEFQWLSAVGLATAKDVTPRVVEPLPRHRVTEIYARRSKLNTKRNKPINGFEHLLKMLASTTTDKVRIHALLKSGKKYFVFTDPDMNELLGVLGPLRTEGDSVVVSPK